MINDDSACSFLTRTSLADFASRVSGLDAAKEITQRTGDVLSLSSLHAKVYVIDPERAVTSELRSLIETRSVSVRNRRYGQQMDWSSSGHLRSFAKSNFKSSRQEQNGYED